MTDSQQLLAEYVRNGSEPAFRELVVRYVNLVYSAAVRLVDGDTHLAEDVAQTVFVDLARAARKLSQNVLLGGWLHRHTCFVAAHILRSERRRRARERQAVEMNALQEHSEPNLAQVKAILDEAIDQLGPEDRTAILLRYFEQHDFRSVGAALGSNEDAARMRVNRALEKLHALLKQRGVVLPVATLGTVLASDVILAAPAGLATSVAGAVLAGSAATGGLSITLLKLMTMTKLKTGIAGALIVAGVATPVVIHQKGKLREHDLAVQQQADQLSQLTAENQRLSNLAAQAKSPFTDDQLRELMKLRGEVGLLRRQTNDLGKLAEENRRLRATMANARSTTQPAESDPVEEQQRQMAIAKLTDAKVLMLGLILHADKNQNRMAANFDELTPYLANAPALTGTNEFDIVYRGSYRDIAKPASTIVVRERQAWQSPDGKWAKTYGFADGHSEVHSEAGNNFETWEKQRLVAPQP